MSKIMYEGKLTFARMFVIENLIFGHDISIFI